MRNLIGVLFSLFLVFTTSCSGGGSSSSTSTSTGSTSKVALGINFDAIGDGSPSHFFADIIKQGRSFGTFADPTVATTIDASGWPLGDSSIIVATAYGHFENSAPYKLSFTGTATADCVGCSVSNQATSNNTTTADVIIQPGVDNYLTFANTRRLPTDQTATGVTNVRLIAPGHQQTDTFNRDMIARLNIFNTLRFMSLEGSFGGGIADNRSVNWSDRIVPSYARQTTNTGMAYEYLVQLANLAGKDVWISIPLLANADHITKMAQLFAYGSDGNLPYTGAYGSTADPVTNPRPAPANPAYPALNSNLKIYVEFSNENWNTTDFVGALQNQTAASTEYNAGNPYGYIVNQTNPTYPTATVQLGIQREMKTIIDISNSFRAVFGNSAMMTRVRPVFASQFQNWPLFNIALNYAVARGYTPVSNYLYGIATAVYINVNDERGDDTLTTAQVLSQMQNNLTKTGGYNDGIDQFKALVAGYDSNLKILGYEGGSGNESAKSYAAKLAAQSDPQMKTIIVNMLHHWYAAGGGQFNYFSLCSSWAPGQFGYFGLSNDITSEATLKWDAVKQIASGQ